MTFQSSLFVGLSCLLLPLLVVAQSPEDGSSGSSGDSDGTGGIDDAAGGAGTDSGFVNLSSGATAAIIVVAAVVGVGGIASAVLFYLAKKRQWAIRQSIRRSARRLTGNFNNARARNANRKSRGVTQLPDDKAPPAPPPKNADVEKGKVKVRSTFEIEPPTPQPWTAKMFSFGKRTGR